MKIPLKIISPTPAQHYDCTGCGDCCRGRFAILITQEDRDRIEGQNWTDEELSLGGRPLFTKHGDNFQLAHRADGACVFLQPDNLCRIHARYGEAAKPAACRLYPFRLIPTGSQAHVDVRFDCPATAGNLGRAIPAHRPDLTKLLPHVVPADAAAIPAPPFYGSVRLSWKQLESITETFDRVLSDVSIDITRRITACVNLAAVLRESQITAETADLDEILDTLASTVQQVALEDTLPRTAPLGSERMIFRQMLGLYARIDTVGEKANLSRRLNASLRMLAGKGNVPALRDGFPQISFANIDSARGIPAGPAAASLERYLHVHLTGMGFFGSAFYGRGYLDGLGALLLTYPLICWFARAFALGDGLPGLDGKCVERALMIVNHQHGTTPLLDLPTERRRTHLLCERSTLRSLVIRYGS